MVSDYPEYRKSLIDLREEVEKLVEIMNDPYKAPELTIFALPKVLTAMWEAQIEFTVMMRSGERKRAKKVKENE